MTATTAKKATDMMTRIMMVLVSTAMVRIWLSRVVLLKVGWCGEPSKKVVLEVCRGSLNRTGEKCRRVCGEEKIISRTRQCVYTS